jgi:hypothetical protein
MYSDPYFVNGNIINIFKQFFFYLNYFSETGGGGASHKEVMKLRKDYQQISEENNLLKLKIDILLDMASIFLSEGHMSLCLSSLAMSLPASVLSTFLTIFSETTRII